MYYDVLMRVSNSYEDNRKKMAELKNTYGNSIAKYQHRSRIEQLSDSDVELLYRSANVVAFYTKKVEDIGDMKKDLDVLRERGLAYDRHYRDLYEAYISVRMLDEANQLLQQHPFRDVDPIPAITVLPFVQGEPRAFLVDKESDHLRLQSVDVNEGIKIIAVSHPLCHFSSHASQYIESDDALKKLFDRYAIWLVPASRKIEFHLMREWSQEHSKDATMLAYKATDWPMITSWDTPTFYFLKDGQVVDIVAGWPKQGHRAALRAALRKVGLAPEVQQAQPQPAATVLQTSTL